MQSIAKALAVATLAAGVMSQACPDVHIFGARETTAPAGYGTGGQFVNLILAAYSGSTAEAIDYPAQGDSAYASSVQAGTKNIASQINAFNTKCPDSRLVVVGYSQVSLCTSLKCASGTNPIRVRKSATMLSVAAGIQTRASQTRVCCSRPLRAPQ